MAEQNESKVRSVENTAWDDVNKVVLDTTKNAPHDDWVGVGKEEYEAAVKAEAEKQAAEQPTA